MRTRVFLLILAVFVLGASSTNADDTIATLAAGGLVPVKSTLIVMESEDLEISVHTVTVRYIFQNTSGKDIDALIEFPLPDLEGGIGYFNSVDIPDEKRLNFLDFRVLCNSKPVGAKVEARGFFKNHDITARLHAAGLPVSTQYDKALPAIEKLAPAKRKQLEREGLIEQQGPNEWIANWTERIKFYWKQHFPAYGQVTLVQTYRPSVGGGYFWPGSGDGTLSVREYCANTESFQRIAELQKLIHPAKMSGSDITLYEREIDFILTTGNNWSGPIRHFRLLVKSDSRQDIVLTCMPGLKRIGPTRYQLTRTNFHPSSDLKLLILQPNKETMPSQ